jgi:hypothetical protein
MLRLTTFSAAALLTASSAFAGPLNTDHVAADARWILHFDVESFVKSQVGSCILEHRHQLDMEGIDEINEALGIDVFQDVLGATVYGGVGDNMKMAMHVDDEAVSVGAEARAVEKAVAVIVMSEAADRMIEKLKEGESYAEVHKDGFVLHSFTEPESSKRHNVYIERGANANQRLVVAGPDLMQVVHAIKVVHDDAKSLQSADMPLAKMTPRAGSFAFTTALEIAGISGDDPASRILECSRQLTFDVGEDLGKAFAVLEVTADSDEDASNISQILQGLVALGRMALANGDEETRPLLKLLNGIKFLSHGDFIVADLEFPADECCQMILEKAERQKRRDKNDDHDHDNDDRAQDHNHGSNFASQAD